MLTSIKKEISQSGFNQEVLIPLEADLQETKKKFF